MGFVLLRGFGTFLGVYITRMKLTENRDLLLIGNQSRPKIFDLNIRRAEPLYSRVIEVCLFYTSGCELMNYRLKRG